MPAETLAGCLTNIRMSNNFSNNLRKMSAHVLRFANSEYPAMAGKIALRFIDDNFRNQSWEGIPWKPRRGGAKRNKGRGLLINRAVLRRGNRIRSLPGAAIVYNDVRYASVHNNGFNGPVNIPAHNRKLYGKYKASNINTRKTRTIRTQRGSAYVKAHVRNMRIARRQFMPTLERPSPTLNNQVKRAVTLELMKILKTYGNNLSTR